MPGRGQGTYRARMQLLTDQDRTVNQRLDAELEKVEGRFAAELISDLPCVNALVSHIEQYRGKMLRPRLVLVAAMACTDADEPLNDAHCVLATVVEMVHMATLVHDDILDDADVRRRGRTINDLEGNETAIMLGDFLISHAYHLCSSLSDPRISRTIADTTNTVCEGELLQLANRNNRQLDEQTYFEIIRRKTASLCGTCCWLAASLAGGDDEVADGLYEYGERVGVAFQIVDDLLDLVGLEDTVGKSLGRDLQKGKLTLPLIRHLMTAAEPARQQLADLLDRVPAGLDPDQVSAIRQLIIASGSVEYANDWASRLVEQAKTPLARLPDTPARGQLARIADTVLTRKS